MPFLASEDIKQNVVVVDGEFFPDENRRKVRPPDGESRTPATRWHPDSIRFPACLSAPRPPEHKTKATLRESQPDPASHTPLAVTWPVRCCSH